MRCSSKTKTMRGKFSINYQRSFSPMNHITPFTSPCYAARSHCSIFPHNTMHTPGHRPRQIQISLHRLLFDRFLFLKRCSPLGRAPTIDHQASRLVCLLCNLSSLHIRRDRWRDSWFLTSWHEDGMESWASNGRTISCSRTYLMAWLISLSRRVYKIYGFFLCKKH